MKMRVLLLSLLASIVLTQEIFPEEWQILGPFPIGTRELGTDPLSSYGGFENLVYSPTDFFFSELSEAGLIRWSTQKAVKNVVSIIYNSVKWDFIRDPFGWASNQHYTYARAQFNISTSGIYLISFDNVVSYKIDRTAFVGNVYSYKHASSSSIWLNQGMHTVYVCVAWDVRVHGSGTPKPWFSGSFIKIDMDKKHGLISFPDDTILPQVIQETNNLTNVFASITLMNIDVSMYNEKTPTPFLTFQSSNNIPPNNDDKFSGWIQIKSIKVYDENNLQLPSRIATLFTVRLAPGQIYPLPIEITSTLTSNLNSLRFTVVFLEMTTKNEFELDVEGGVLEKKKWGDVYKITYIGYDGAVSYSMVLPPKKECSAKKKEDVVNGIEPKCGVVVALHGAGVDAHSEAWTSSYRRRDNEWILFPSGRTSWGFDWHGPSHLSTQTSLLTLQTLPGVPAQLRISPDISKLAYTGHSNGGQGAWFLASHYPDNAVAAVPASGYVKIQFYVPYYMRGSDSFTDPMLKAVLESSIAEGNVDLYSSNMQGIPILARTGSLDDNVPPIHSRKMVRLVNEWSNHSNEAFLSEIPGQPHWFNGILSDDRISNFLDTAFATPSPPLTSFSLITLNPASSGSKGGIKILQLEVPFRLGEIRVHVDNGTVRLVTTNIRRFQFVDEPKWKERDAGNWRGVDKWWIDRTEMDSPPIVGPSYLNEEGLVTSWKTSNDLLWLSDERHSSTYGPAFHVLSHQFLIIIPSSPTTPSLKKLYYSVAQNIALSWYIYGRGATQIVFDDEVRDGDAARYNMIVLGGPEDNKWTKRRESEGGKRMVRYLEGGGYQIGRRIFVGTGIGIIFIAPSPTRTRMGLFIGGTDIQGFLRAAWSIPFRTGLMVPDYMIVGPEFGDPSSGWTAGDGSPHLGAGTKGAGGVLAAGYWNNTWEFDDRCGYLK